MSEYLKLAGVLFLSFYVYFYLDEIKNKIYWTTDEAGVDKMFKNGEIQPKEVEKEIENYLKQWGQLQ